MAPFRFLDLPAEMRNMVYNYTLHGIQIFPSDHFPWTADAPQEAVSLTQTNQQIRTESLNLYWATTLFAISTQDVVWGDVNQVQDQKWVRFQQWLNLVPEARRSQVARVFVYSSGWAHDGIPRIGEHCDECFSFYAKAIFMGAEWQIDMKALERPVRDALEEYIPAARFDRFYYEITKFALDRRWAGVPEDLFMSEFDEWYEKLSNELTLNTGYGVTILIDDPRLLQF